MAACMYVMIDGFRFNACLGVCGRCIAPDCSDGHTRKAVLDKNPALFDALSKAVCDMDSIMVTMDIWQLDPEWNCGIDRYRATAQKVLQSPYADEDDRVKAQKALNWLPTRRPKEERQFEHGYIYVLQAPAMDPALYKIGREKVLNSRVDSLGITLPWNLELIAHIESDDYIGLEAELHHRFASKRDKGEWFRLRDEDIEYLKGLANDAGRTRNTENLLPE